VIVAQNFALLYPHFRFDINFDKKMAWAIFFTNLVTLLGTNRFQGKTNLAVRRKTGTEQLAELLGTMGTGN
jgi:hypothetical protein